MLNLTQHAGRMSGEGNGRQINLRESRGIHSTPHSPLQRQVNVSKQQKTNRREGYESDFSLIIEKMGMVVYSVILKTLSCTSCCMLYMHEQLFQSMQRSILMSLKRVKKNTLPLMI